MKALATFVSIGVFAFGLFFGFQGKQVIDEYKGIGIELKRLSNEYGECRYGRATGLLRCPSEEQQELYSALETLELKVEKAREMMIIGFATAICGPIAIFLFYIFLTTVVFPGVKKGSVALATVVQNKAASVHNSIQEAQARKVVENAVLDEAARVATRAAMTVFDEKEVSAMQKQINDALAKGDYETAQALMSTLRKIEGK
jgi:hypothetical protein